MYVRLCVRASYLAADHDGPHGGVCVGVLPESVVERDDVQNVEQLALVLVNALDLDVEHGRRVDAHAKLSLDVRRQLHLVLLTHTIHTHNRLADLCPGPPR